MTWSRRNDAHDDEITENDSANHFELSAIEFMEGLLLVKADGIAPWNLTIGLEPLCFSRDRSRGPSLAHARNSGCLRSGRGR
jgi:hypothetical protein